MVHYASQNLGSDEKEWGERRRREMDPFRFRRTHEAEEMSCSLENSGGANTIHISCSLLTLIARLTSLQQSSNFPPIQV